MAEIKKEKIGETKSANEEMKSALEFRTTRTDTFAVFMTNFLGSIIFLIGAIIFFVVWICWNLR